MAVTDWGLQRRLRVAVAALAVVLLLTGLALVVTLVQADHALSRPSERSYPARRAAAQLLTSLVDQETGLRGFALTGDEQFLTPYRDGLVTEQAKRAELERYIDMDDSARLALVTVDAAVTAWRDQYASLQTATTRAAPDDPTIQFGRELFERVRQTFADLDSELANEIQRATNDAAASRQVVVLVLVVIGVVVAAALIALQRALRSSVLHPLSRLAEQVALVSGGAHDSEIHPEGPPDLRAIGERVESMRVELVNAATELVRSNTDLEQFAYVASHDLQEPLRKVASFCQLLEQRYGDQLDDRAKQYIEFAVDGARRMQLLITDLLTFSRVGRTNEDFTPVDFAETTNKAWRGLEAKAEESGAELVVAIPPETPDVFGAPSLLHLLMTNLLANAIKYRRDGHPPRIVVSATNDGALLHVTVADNGIGIPDEYADKVFVIFQRLHGRDEYEGTGIGLALAKKVVEFHGGTISLVPSQVDGACVSFTLPVAKERANA